MVKRDDIIWLAGLLEGEGWFGLREGKRPILVLAMTDEDVVAEVATIWGASYYRYRTIWRTQINGVVAIQWMMTLCTLLGKRRKETVIGIIKYWRDNSRSQIPTCHPERKLRSFDLCSPCYYEEYRKKQEEKRLLKLVG